MSTTKKPEPYWSAADTPRFQALIDRLGGFKTLPGIEPGELRRIAELTHPQWHDPKGVYDHEAHEKLTERIRLRALKPLNMAISRQVSFLRTSLNDHGVRLYVRRSRSEFRAWWASPYYDSKTLVVGRNPHIDATEYAMRVANGLADKDLRGLVLGVGSHHPAAVDLLLWDIRQDHEMKRRVKAAGWPDFIRDPIWYWVDP